MLSSGVGIDENAPFGVHVRPTYAGTGDGVRRGRATSGTLAFDAPGVRTDGTRAQELFADLNLVTDFSRPLAEEPRSVGVSCVLGARLG